MSRWRAARLRVCTKPLGIRPPEILVVHGLGAGRFGVREPTGSCTARRGRGNHRGQRGDEGGRVEPLPDRAHQSLRKLRPRPQPTTGAAALRAADPDPIVSSGRRACVNFWSESLPGAMLAAFLKGSVRARAKPRDWHATDTRYSGDILASYCQ